MWVVVYQFVGDFVGGNFELAELVGHSLKKLEKKLDLVLKAKKLDFERKRVKKWIVLSIGGAFLYIYTK